MKRLLDEAVMEDEEERYRELNRAQVKSLNLTMLNPSTSYKLKNRYNN